MANPGLGGMIPTRKVYPPNKYTITAAAAKIYIGSPVLLVAAGTVSIGGATGALLGAVAAIFDADGVPQNYYPGDSSAGWTCMVHDDPDQHYIMSEDGAVAPIALAARGNTALLVAPGTGSLVTGLSAAQIDSSTAVTASAATDQLRILSKIDAPDNDLGADCRWLVKINAHQNVDNTAGV